MTHTLQATAWTLIHFCWQAAAIAAVYCVVSPAFARRGSQARYLLALMALLGMLASSVITFAWMMRATALSQVFTAASSTIADALPSGDFPRVVAPGMGSTEQASAAALSLASLRPNLMSWIDTLWIVGVVMLSLRSLGGWWLIQRLRATAASEAPAAVLASFQRISSALGLRRTVLLRVSDAIAGPLTIGALRAVVLLPLSAITSLGPDELEVVLAHELAHVRRADFVWNLVQTVVETLFFFHPAVWWVSGRIRHERELCCDDLALQVCPNPVVYASALFHLEEQRSRQMRLAMALDGHQSAQTLRMRIARILGEPARAAIRPVRPFSLAAVFASLVVLLLPAPQVIASLRPAHPVAAKVFATSAPGISTLPAIPAMSSHVAASSPRPTPKPDPRVLAPEPVQMVARVQAQSESKPPAAEQESTGTKGSYIDRMKAAGYDVDLDKFMALKIQDVTPEYARAMSQLGFGKPSADELIACRIHGVSPEAINQFKQQGLEVKSLQDAISYRIFEVTPEFVAGMKAAGFKDLNSKQLLSLRVQGVTPEYARSIAQEYPGATVDDVVKTRIFNIDADFIACAKKHGFNNLSLQKLVQLRISGLLDDESAK